MSYKVVCRIEVEAHRAAEADPAVKVALRTAGEDLCEETKRWVYRKVKRALTMDVAESIEGCPEEWTDKAWHAIAAKAAARARHASESRADIVRNAALELRDAAIKLSEADGDGYEDALRCVGHYNRLAGIRTCMAIAYGE